jgi:hypothetical protein
MITSNFPILIDSKLFNYLWDEVLPLDLEKILAEKFGDGLIPFTSNFFDIYSHPQSALTVDINETYKQPFVYPEQWENLTKFPLNGVFSSQVHNVLAIEAHQTFLILLLNYVFGLKKLKKRFFYHTSRSMYDVIKWVYLLDGIDKTLVPYLKEGYKIRNKRFLKCDGQKDIRIVWDHYNYPEPYFKKLLIFCIKHKVWPSFDIFLQEAFYPTGKCVILRKEVHDELGASEDDNRGTMYKDAGIEVCDYHPPYKEKSNSNIWAEGKQKHLVRSNGVMDF